MEQSKPFVFRSLLLLLMSCQLLPWLTSCLGDGLRVLQPRVRVLPGLCDSVNRLALLPGLKRSLIRLISDYEEKRWGGAASYVMVLVEK